MIYKELEDSILKILECNTSLNKKDTSEEFEKFVRLIKMYYTNNDINAIKTVISGCSLFINRNGMERIFSNKKIDKNHFKYKIQIAKLHLYAANNYLNLIR